MAVQYLHINDRQNIESLLHNCLARQKSEQTLESTESHTLLVIMILDLIRILYDQYSSSVESSIHVELSDKVVKILDWIDTHYAQTFHLTLLSEHV